MADQPRLDWSRRLRPIRCTDGSITVAYADDSAFVDIAVSGDFTSTNASHGALAFSIDGTFAEGSQHHQNSSPGDEGHAGFMSAQQATQLAALWIAVQNYIGEIPAAAADSGDQYWFGYVERESTVTAAELRPLESVPASDTNHGVIVIRAIAPGDVPINIVVLYNRETDMMDYPIVTGGTLDGGVVFTPPLVDDPIVIPAGSWLWAFTTGTVEGSGTAFPRISVRVGLTPTGD